MNTSFYKKVPIPKAARIKPYYDTKQINQNESVINFFPANATRKVTRDNYINNPFPGQDTRRIVGLSFELVNHILKDDATNNIDIEAIINEIKDAGVILNADNNYKEFLRTTLDKHSNFAGTDYSAAVDSELVGAAIETIDVKAVVLKSAGMYRLPDPFDVAPTQTINLTVTFSDSSVFPADADWNTSGQKLLFLRAKLFLGELEKPGRPK